MMKRKMISMKLLVMKKKKLILVKKNMLEHEIDLEVESSSSQNRYIFRKQLTKKRLVHNIDFSLNEDNFEPIFYVNGKGQFEEFTGYLGPKKPKNTKNLLLGSEFPSVTGRQRGCDTVYQPKSCLLPNAKSIDAENFDDLFHLFFDDEIMNIIVYHTNNKIKAAISHLKKNPKFVENLSKYPQVKGTDIIEINALFGLMYLGGLLGMSLQRVDYLFSDDKAHFAFGAFMSKNRFKFLLSHITFDDYSDQAKKQVNLRRRNISTDRLYTSTECVNWLLDQNITTVGTVQKGRQGIPDELFDTTNREIFSKTCHFEKDKKDLCLTSYTVKTKSKGRKNVVACQQHVHYIVVQKMIKSLNRKYLNFTISPKEGLT